MNQIGTFDYDSLTIFTNKVTSGKVGPIAFPGDFDVEEKNCVEFHEKRTANQAKKAEEDAELEQEILREILEEERKKKEQIEKELKEAKKSSKKKKKSKKEDL